MPDRVLLSALDLKWADYNCLALQVALTTAEIKFMEQQQAFLCTMRDQNDGELAIGGASLDTPGYLLTQLTIWKSESLWHACCLGTE